MRKLLTILLMSLMACESNDSFDKEKAIAEIMDLHRMQQKVHLEEDPEAFADLLSDRFISVNRGSISRPTRQQNIDRFSSYFSSVEFEKWDDLSDPVISFSDDGSLAYSIVHKEVQLSFEDEDGAIVRERTEYAWMAIYRKTKAGWTIESVASTNLPSEQLSGN